MKSFKRDTRSSENCIQFLSCEKLERRFLLSTVQLIAAGQEGGEAMTLTLDGVDVDTWLVSEGANSGQFSTYTYVTSDTVTPDQVRIYFTNDLYNPPSTDRNLRLDAIVIDGQRYETEDPSVFSTGTWLPADGVQPGNRESEYLHSNGYLQFAGTSGSGSTIQIRARGDEGGEQFRLLVDQVPVQTFTSTTTLANYSYTSSQPVSADQLRIEFLNDQYDPSAGIDRNLIVDFIRVDGTTYQTEAATTFSTGTWQSSDGITPGFRQSEVLHTNGYFQYLADDNGSPGEIRWATGQVTVNENAGTVQIPLERMGGSVGAASAFFQTVEVEAQGGSDFTAIQSGTVNFADGQTSAVATVSLLNDSVFEPTETFSVSLFGTEGAELGFVRTSIVTIVDDDSANGIGGLVGHWKLNETSIGQPVVDSSGQVNNGEHRSIAAPSGPSTDVPNLVTANPRSLFLDGVNDYVRVGSDLSLDLSGGEFTQALWIKSNTTDNGTYGILGRDNNDFSQRYPSVWLTEGDRILAGFGDGINWNSLTTGSVLSAPNAWNHVATTFDGTTFRVFVNGTQVASTNDFAGRDPVGVSRVDIGRVDSNFGGYIDDVRIYNRALSATELAVVIDGADTPPISTDGEFVPIQIASSFDNPTEIEWLPDGRMLVSELQGLVKIVNNDGTVQSDPLLDIRSIVNNSHPNRGVIGMAVHPDFANNPYLYVAYTYDPPEVQNGSGDAGLDGDGARVARISRFTFNASATAINPNSEFILVGNASVYSNIGNPDSEPELGDPHSCIDANGNPIEDCIPMDSLSHTIGELQFGPDGLLYAASGDGGAFGRVEPNNVRALDIDSLAGKILRIDPITGEGVSSNPFYDGDPDSNRSKVFVYGLRNPYRFAIAGPVANPTIYVGDVGWATWEEINIGTGSENFGWPAFEGGNGQSLQTSGYQDLSEVQAYYATNPDVTAPAWSRLHSDGARAIVAGDFYNGQFLFADIGDQLLRSATIDANGNFTNQAIVSQELGFVVEIQVGPDGNLYYVDFTGSIGRLDFFE